MFCFFLGPNVHFWVQNYSFYPKFVHFSEIFWKNFIFSVKSTIFLFFWDQMYICMQNYSFYPKFVHFSEFFSKNFIFSVKSTILLVFQDQMHILGYKNTVFIQNLYILVKFVCKNFIFSVKSTIFFYFSGPNVHFWVQNKFLSKICTF